MNRTAAVCTSIASLALLGSAAMLVAGPLNPPAGPVSGTYKTLAEVEPRTVINSTNTPGDNDATPSVYKIAARGSYYLPGNIEFTTDKIAIEVTSSDVTIDLGGFTIRGLGNGTGVGVTSSGLRNISVRNGVIVGMLGSGVDLGVGAVTLVIGSSVERLVVSECSGHGLELGDAAAVSGCTVTGNLTGGIRAGAGARVESCTAASNGFVGIAVGEGSVVRACASSGNGVGIAGGFGCNISGCVARENTGDGISVLDKGVVTGCEATDNGDTGISTNTADVLDCTAMANGGHGIFGNGVVARCQASANAGAGIVGSSAIVEGCRLNSNGAQGVWMSAGGVVTGCTVVGNVLHGIEVGGSALVRGNQCAGNGNGGTGAGIRVTGSGSRVEDNNVHSNDFGVQVTGTVNAVFGNTARANPSNYEIIAGNRVGTIVIPPVSGAITGNGPGAGFGTTDPWANIAF